jgi:hypothetical protein
MTSFKDKLKSDFNWLTQSNRPKHILVGFIIAVIGSFIAGNFMGAIYPAITAAFAAEYKDWAHGGWKGGKLGFLKGNEFDWKDLLATVIGSLLGASISLIWSL